MVKSNLIQSNILNTQQILNISNKLNLIKQNLLNNFLKFLKKMKNNKHLIEKESKDFYDRKVIIDN